MSIKLESVEKEIEQNKEEIELGLALKRLKDNKDFKKIFIDLYLMTEPARLVEVRAAPYIQSNPNELRSVDNAINAIGYFAQFLRTIEVAGERATENLADNEQTRQELLSEI